MNKKYSFILMIPFFLVFTSVVRATDINNSNNIVFSTILNTPPTDPWLTSGNGEKINVTSGDRVQIRTMSRNHLRLQVNECVEICINESDINPVGPIQNQTRAVNKFMHITMNRTCAMNATLYRNYTNNELEGLGNVSTFRWAWYNETKSQWQYANQNWVEMNPEGANVYCNTTHFSVWTILAPNIEIDKNPTPGSPFDASNGTGFTVQAGNTYQIRTQSGFSLQLQINKSVEVTITEYEVPPKVMTQARHQVRTQTMAININDSNAEVQANLSYTFTSQTRNQLGIQNMQKLKFMFFNETSNQWEAPKYQWFDGEILFCNTTHFSLWTIAEEELETTDSLIPGFSILGILIGILPFVLYKQRRK